MEGRDYSTPIKTGGEHHIRALGMWEIGKI